MNLVKALVLAEVPSRSQEGLAVALGGTMLRNVKYGKIAIVVFITILIWVWADLALDERLTISNAIISVATSNPKLWVTMNDAPSLSIDEITLKGPHRRITELSRKLKRQERLQLDFDPALEKISQPGTYTLPLLNLLRDDKELKESDLKVESCKPETVTIGVRELVKKLLTVRCLDENKIPVNTESIEPPQIEMLVPDDWQGERLVANVQLTQREIEQARLTPFSKKPYIELSTGQVRQASTGVKVKMPPKGRLNDYVITAPRLMFALSMNLQGKYKVEVENLPEVLSAIKIKATDEAKQAYENMRYHVILEIDDDDVKAEESRREVVYNFPKEFIRKDEIVLNQPRAQARFKLLSISAVPE